MFCCVVVHYSDIGVDRFCRPYEVRATFSPVKGYCSGHAFLFFQTEIQSVDCIMGVENLETSSESDRKMKASVCTEAEMLGMMCRY